VANLQQTIGLGVEAWASYIVKVCCGLDCVICGVFYFNFFCGGTWGEFFLWLVVFLWVVCFAGEGGGVFWESCRAWLLLLSKDERHGVGWWVLRLWGGFFLGPGG